MSAISRNCGREQFHILMKYHSKCLCNNISEVLYNCLWFNFEDVKFLIAMRREDFVEIKVAQTPANFFKVANSSWPVALQRP